MMQLPRRAKEKQCVLKKQEELHVECNPTKHL